MASNFTSSKPHEKEQASPPQPDEPPSTFAHLLNESLHQNMLTPESLNSLLDQYGKSKAAFYRKTVQESSMRTTLKHYPGVQLWYLKRLVYLEDQGKIGRLKAAYFKEMAKNLKRFANAMLDFAGFLDHIFNLHQIADAFKDMVNVGHPRRIPQGIKSNQILMSFSDDYLWSLKKDEEVRPVLQQREKDTLFFPRIFHQIVAEIHFENNHEKADQMFESPPPNARPKFTSHLQILGKRSHSATESKNLKKENKYMLRSTTQSHTARGNSYRDFGWRVDPQDEASDSDESSDDSLLKASKPKKTKSPPTFQKATLEFEITHSQFKSTKFKYDISKMLKLALADVPDSPQEESSTMKLPQNAEGTTEFSPPK